MHACTTCKRQFTTKGSLHRHEQNHQRTREYTCSFCNITFLRQDLLTRHARMHEDESSSSNTGRVRSRKACETCRQARTKCNGHLPCERCKSRNLVCAFGDSNATSRTSRDARMITLNPLAAADSSLDEYAVLPGGEQQLALDDGDTFGIDNSLPELSMTHTSLSPFATSWPWLHEDLFLQSAMSLDFFDVTGDSAESQIVEASESNIPINDQHDTVPTNTNSMRGLDISEKPKEDDVIRSIVECASRWTKKPRDIPLQSSFDTDLRSLCWNVAAAFDFERGDNCIATFITLYEEHFWPLWPLISRFQLRFHTLHPFLYLAMASIGAMYGGKHAAAFGTILHNQLREELIKPFFEYDITDRDMISLGQARSLTQAAALYFGQKRAFSFAQHISANLVAQARRTSLFSMQSPIVLDSGKSKTWLDSWIRRENRKRLAIAILRLEMYSSVLHSKKPLVSAEELEIELPCSRYLWHNPFDSTDALLFAVKHELLSQGSRPLFSDLIRIAFDPSESLPNLDTLEQELVFNSMQDRVWAACAARDTAERLTGRQIYNNMACGSHDALSNGSARSALTPQPGSRRGPSLDSHIASSSRTMNSLTSTISILLCALQKCHASLTSTSASIYNSPSAADRTSLLSCLLTYHLSHLQLYAPLPTLHNACHLYTQAQSSSAPTSTPIPPDEHTLSKIKSWCSTRSASAARAHAAHIYHLLRSEADKPVVERASVNFLTTIGLYHSAVVLWVSEKARKAAEQDRSSNSITVPQWNMTQSNLYRDGNANVDAEMDACSSTVPEPSISAFVTLFHDLNPAWAARSSFCAALQQLVTSPSPFTS